MNVAVDATSGDDHTFASDDFSGATNGHCHIRLYVGIAGFADGGDTTGFEADVGFDDAPMVHNDGVSDDGVHHVAMCALRLTHAITDDFAAAEFDFFAIGGVVFFDLDKEFGICQPDTVAGGRAEHFGIGFA